MQQRQLNYPHRDSWVILTVMLCQSVLWQKDESLWKGCWPAHRVMERMGSQDQKVSRNEVSLCQSHARELGVQQLALVTGASSAPPTLRSLKTRWAVAALCPEQCPHCFCFSASLTSHSRPGGCLSLAGPPTKTHAVWMPQAQKQSMISGSQKKRCGGVNIHQNSLRPQYASSPRRQQWDGNWYPSSIDITVMQAWYQVNSKSAPFLQCWKKNEKCLVHGLEHRRCSLSRSHYCHLHFCPALMLIRVSSLHWVSPGAWLVTVNSSTVILYVLAS